MNTFLFKSTTSDESLALVRPIVYIDADVRFNFEDLKLLLDHFVEIDSFNAIFSDYFLIIEVPVKFGISQEYFDSYRSLGFLL